MSAFRETACPRCGAANRFPLERDASAAKCGHCGAKLYQARPVDVDDAALKQHLAHTSGAVLLDVWAPWCGPCRMMAPHFAEAAQALEPHVRFLKLNADENASAGALGVRGIPALILFKNGREIARHAGAMTAAQLIAWAQGQLRAA